MFDMSSLGKTLVIFGLALVFIGALFMLGGRLPWFGRLPGDIMVQRRNFTFYFPLTTSILISVVISLVMFILRRR